jgi:hypothetical protein
MGCQRPEGEMSKLTLTLPQSSGAATSQSISTLAFPVGKKICYGVNVVGDGIPSKSDACSPVLGAHVGFLEEGQTVVLEVNKGKGRTVEVYAYVDVAGSVCPSLAGDANVNRQKVFLVATEKNVNTETDVTLRMTAVYPGDGDHIASTLSMPSSCLGSNTGDVSGGIAVGTTVGVSGARIGHAEHYSSGTTLHLKGHFGSTVGAQTSGSGVKLHVE